MNKKESIFTKVFYAGVGIGAMTVEKLEKSLSSIFEENTLSIDELKEQLNKLVKDLATKKEDVSAQLDKYIQDTVEKFKFAKQSDLQELLKKLEELEKLIEQKNINKK